MKFNTKKIAALFAVISFFSFGQDGENLVPNPSFESVGKKPKRLGQIEGATGWVMATGAKPDLFTPNKYDDINVPLNVYGKEEAQEGSNYAGFVAYSHGGKDDRTYMMTKLDSPLKKGMTYCVKFYVSLAEASKYVVPTVGMRFAKKPYGTSEKMHLIEDEGVFMHFKADQDKEILSARYNWTEICGNFVAKGGEKYITIGNFTSDKDLKDRERIVRMKPDKNIKVAQVPNAYFYVDNVSVQLLDTDKGEKCECAAEDAGDSYSTTIYHQVITITEEMTDKDKIEAQQVYFAFGKRKLITEGEQALDQIAEWMKANPEMKLEVRGHNNTMEDEVGMENDYYADMDNKRIGTVMDYLASKGIDKGRMIPAPKGDQSSNAEITDADDDDLKMAKDRRVSFKVR
jgi:outer membrane protein OmpA-like peptidoglycan-associated protein